MLPHEGSVKMQNPSIFQGVIESGLLLSRHAKYQASLKCPAKRDIPVLASRYTPGFSWRYADAVMTSTKTPPHS